MRKFKVYTVSILISLAVGILSALATMGNMDIYATVNPPLLAPPAILFPIVWTILYALMGVSSAMIYLSSVPISDKSKALFTYAVSLFVNFFWSIFFFNMQAFLLSFVWLILLLALILLTILDYFKINRLAAILQIPYLIWVSFAGYLNLAIVILN
jgi:tryptophan-rich sensory protein